MSAKYPKPYFVAGAERLTSSVYKRNMDRIGIRYQFNVVCLNESTGEVTHWLQPDDLEAIVKLTRVLAAELADDGCMEQPLRRRLRTLAKALDETIQKLAHQNLEEHER